MILKLLRLDVFIYGMNSRSYLVFLPPRFLRSFHSSRTSFEETLIQIVSPRFVS